MSATDEKWAGVVALMAKLETAAFDAMRAGGPVRLDVAPNMALALKDALQHWMDHEQPLYRPLLAIEDHIIRAAEVADEMMQDQHTRFAMALGDLELLLENFLGRPAPTLDEVRRARSTTPIIKRARSSIPVSDELARSVREKRIGQPRDPGEDG